MRMETRKAKSQTIEHKGLVLLRAKGKGGGALEGERGSLTVPGRSEKEDEKKNEIFHGKKSRCRSSLQVHYEKKRSTSAGKTRTEDCINRGGEWYKATSYRGKGGVMMSDAGDFPSLLPWWKLGMFGGFQTKTLNNNTEEGGGKYIWGLKKKGMEKPYSWSGKKGRNKTKKREMN